MDASASMLTDDAPGVRFEAAQGAIGSLVEALPDDHELGLVAFGNGTGATEAEQAAGCEDVSTLIELGPLDKDTYISTVEEVAPSGFTPIAVALTHAAELLPAEGERAIVIVSDGEDKCGELGLGEDPCEVAKALDGVTVHTVGFKTEAHQAAMEQLSCVAEATGGLFLDAANPGQLQARLPAVLDPSWAESTIQPAGYRGLRPGMTVAEARAAAEDAGEKLPDVEPSGTVEVVYVDCTLVFEEGVLTRVVSDDEEMTTIDGVGVGDDVAAAEELYNLDGLPSEPTEAGTVVYPADPATGTGYEISFDGEGDSLSGTITQIILCKCMPKKRWSDDPSEWEIGPGYFGPLEVGMPMAEIADQGYAQKIPDDVCTGIWEGIGVLSPFVYMLSDASQNPSSGNGGLHGLRVFDAETFITGVPSEGLPRTVEGLGIGTTVDELQQIYGERLHFGQWIGEGGEMLGYSLFGEKGALVFEVGTAMQPATTVQAIQVVSGASFDDLEKSVLRC
ncbi:MAG: VWA domain-containing protein [Aeromicrobium sp.]|uniref:vWA domain-containing protein n=1 Tax=Aeromicrobium sp. TaxID=1871063 RepID=UPI0039E5F85C